MSFSAFWKFSVGTGENVTNVTFCASACTPASVRPEPCGNTFSPVIRPMAKASVPCTVAASGCTCHPENSDPSYERINLRFRRGSLESGGALESSNSLTLMQAILCDVAATRGHIGVRSDILNRFHGILV